MIKKKFLTFILILSVVSSAFYNPVSAPRSQAILGFGDINLESVPTIVRFILDKIAPPMAQRMVDGIVRETIIWANSGFEDNPAYVTDPGGYFTRIADGVITDYILGTDIGNDLELLCSPFRDSVRLSLQRLYYEPPGEENSFQCTLSDMVGNIDDFYNDFEVGGWESWITMTQTPANNPYGAILKAQAKLDSRLQSALGIEKEKLSWNQGYLSWSECLPDGIDPETGECRPDMRGPTQTPGSVIKTQLDNVLPSGLNQLINADTIDELVGAFASGLLQRYVFSDAGLFNTNSQTVRSSREVLDVPNAGGVKDGIPDGWDYDPPGYPGYAELDVCHFGLIDPTLSPSNANCVNSIDADTRPYFVPMCDALAGTIKELTYFLAFASRVNFDNEDSQLWVDNISTLAGSVDNLSTTLNRYRDPNYDKTMSELAKYSKFMGHFVNTIIKDGRLKKLTKDRGISTNYANTLSRAYPQYTQFYFQLISIGTGNSTVTLQILDSTHNMIQYLKSFESSIQSCSAPDSTNLNSIPPPGNDYDDADDDTDTTQTPTQSAQVSCTPSTTDVPVDTTVIWASNTNLANPTFSWTGDEIYGDTTASILVSYSVPGIKIASVSVTGDDANGNSQTVSASCSNSVTVTGPGGSIAP